jgi:hypothetical protein
MQKKGARPRFGDFPLQKHVEKAGKRKETQTKRRYTN